MDVPLRSWHIVTLTLYSVVIALLSFWFAWPVAFTLFLLCGVPIGLLIYETNLPLARLLASVGVLSMVIVLVDAFAHLTGGWYTVVMSPWRIYGLTFESLMFAIGHCLYFLVLYEYLMDDGKMSNKLDRRFLNIVAIVVALLVAAFYLFSVYVISFAFSWLIALLLGAIILIMLLARRGDTLHLLAKATMFSFLIWPLSLTFELVSLIGDVRVFAFTSEYIYTFSVYGQIVPIEEIALLVVWPALLVLMYESFIDDAF